MLEQNKAAAVTVAKAVATISDTLNKLPKALQQARAAGAKKEEQLVALVEFGFVMNRIIKQVEEVEELCKKLGKEANDLAASLFLNMPDATGEVETEYVKAKLKVTAKQAGLTRKPDNAEAYDRFVREVLGILNEKLIASGAITTHFVKWGEYLTEQIIAQGYDLPPELKKAFKIYNEFELTYKAKKSLFE